MMNRLKKFLLGVITFAPGLFILSVGGAFLCLALFSDVSPQLIRPPKWLFKAVPSVIFLIFALIAYYQYLLNGNKEISEQQKRTWRIGILFGHFVFMPIYWYRFILKSSPQSS